jgi:MscS family membrane protein
MKWKWDPLYRGCIAAVLLLLLWSVWRVAAQTRGGIALTLPADGIRFDPGARVPMRAEVSPGLRVHQVEFILSGELLAVVSNTPYASVWTNAADGSYSLVARALLEDGSVLDSVPVHFGVYHALLTFGLNHVRYLEQNELFGVPLWQYCASLLYLFLAFYVSKFLDYGMRVSLNLWAHRSDKVIDRRQMDLLKGPVKVALFVAFLRVGIELFSWPAEVQKLVPKIAAIILAVAITYLLLKAVDLAMDYWKDRNRLEADRTVQEQLFPIIRKSVKIFAIMVAMLATLDNIGVNITAAIASLSIGGLAVGLAAQDTLANMFGAVAIFVDKPFRIGDDIKIDGAEGVVEAIGLRSTRLRNPDGFLIAVPNKTMGGATVVNRSCRPNIQTEMNLALAYDTSAEKVRLALKILGEVYRAHPMTLDYQVSFNKFTESAMNIWTLHVWKGTDYAAYLAGMQSMHLVLKERFDAEGIKFGYPTRTVFLKPDAPK